jgi:uncharacterized protein
MGWSIIKMMKVWASSLGRWCVIGLFVCSQYAFAASQPAFWRVSKGDATVYLLGSMHFGHPNFYPLPTEIDAAYNSSSKLVVEVDMSRITPEKASSAIYRYGRLPLGQTLSTALSPEVYTKLTTQAELSKLPLSALERFEPWFVAVQLIEAEIRKTELRQDLGIDLFFINKGQKPVAELETLEHQLSLFGNLTMPEQEVFLEQTLDDMNHSRGYLKSMTDAWMSGDMQSLETTLIDPFKENADTKKLFQKIFTERNDKMTAAVNQYLAQQDSVFVVVGAGHMLGEQGIVAQLKRQGLKVERVKFDASASDNVGMQ